jgi:hypothetical protein
VEDRIRAAKESGLSRLMSREFKINQAWLQLVAVAADLTAWLRLLALTGDLAVVEPSCCGTGCCTSPPDSAGAAGDDGPGCPDTGHGPARYSRRSAGS